jgi:hypothetical protein
VSTSAWGQPAPARKQAVIAGRAAKDKAFAESRTSPMASVDRASFSAGTTVWLGPTLTGYRSGEIRPEGALYRLVSKGQPWSWESLDGKAQGTVTPGQEFDLGVRTVVAYPSATDLTLICFDAGRAEQKAFRHLRYFDDDERYAVPAQLRVFPKPTPVVMATSRQTEKLFYHYADCLFSLGGTPCRLAVFKSELTGPNADTLFIPFTDLTTGKESYPAGRFLEVPDPHRTDFILDFNEAFNPLCNYADTYNCPRPPKENALPVAIRAGEMTYGSGHP